VSTSCDIVTIIMDLAGLVTSLRDLGVVERDIQRTRELVTHDGRRHEVDLVVRSPQGRQLGFQKGTDGHYRVIADTQGLGPKQVQAQTRFVQQIVQRYAYRTVLDRLKAQGYVVAQEEQKADRTIRLVLRKWG